VRVRPDSIGSLLWYLMMDEAHPFSLAIIFTSVGSRLYSLFQKT
jgi:hypothetical protein